MLYAFGSRPLEKTDEKPSAIRRITFGGGGGGCRGSNDRTDPPLFDGYKSEKEKKR